MVPQGGFPIQRACAAVGLGRATYDRPLVNWVRREAPVMAARTTLVAAKSRWGFWKCCARLRLIGHPWHHTRLWRVDCQLRLNLPRRTEKRLPVRFRQPLAVVPRPNVVWAVDFMSATLYGGRRFRTFHILDEGVREGLAIEVDTSLSAERVGRVLEQVVAWRGQPQAIRLDNGPELMAERFMSWCAERAIELRYIQPGKPDQNAFIERFKRTYRTDVLNASVFESVDQVREMSADWLQRDNEERPQDALAGLPPATYRAQLEARSSPIEVSP
jgi:putative transposase